MQDQTQRPATGLGSVLFPEQPRSFPFRRTARAILRAVHILAGGVLLGGYVFNVSEVHLGGWWAWTMATGLLLLATDLHASLAVLVELRGAAIMLKLALVSLVPVAGEAALPLLALVLVVGAVSSHLPRRFRHHVLLLKDRVATDQRYG